MASNWARHTNWAKRPGNLASIGLPDAVRLAIADFPNDYRGELRKKILLTVMAAGAIRMRGHGDVLVFEFTENTAKALPACRGVLRDLAGEFTRCRFNNLKTSQSVEMCYGEYQRHLEQNVV